MYTRGTTVVALVVAIEDGIQVPEERHHNLDAPNTRPGSQDPYTFLPHTGNNTSSVPLTTATSHSADLESLPTPFDSAHLSFNSERCLSSRPLTPASLSPLITGVKDNADSRTRQAIVWPDRHRIVRLSVFHSLHTAASTSTSN